VSIKTTTWIQTKKHLQPWKVKIWHEIMASIALYFFDISFGSLYFDISVGRAVCIYR